MPRAVVVHLAHQVEHLSGHGFGDSDRRDGRLSPDKRRENRLGHEFPAELGQESQESSCLRKGTPLSSRGAQGVSGPLLSCVWNLRVFPEMHDGDSAPSCCAFTHWVAFEEVSGPRVLFKSGQGNRGLSA